MPNQKDAPQWIMKDILGGAYDAMGASTLNLYHEMVLHEDELVASGLLNGDEHFKEKRRQFAKGLNSEIRARMDRAHSELPEHDYLEE